MCTDVMELVAFPCLIDFCRLHYERLRIETSLKTGIQESLLAFVVLNCTEYLKTMNGRFEPDRSWITTNSLTAVDDENLNKSAYLPGASIPLQQMKPTSPIHYLFTSPFIGGPRV
jgi:hypothetical protein